MGGDYNKPNQNFGNKAVTVDVGKTWNLASENNAFGYASCVQYVPNSNAKKMITVGASGVFYSQDGGNTWTQIATEKNLYTLKFIDNKTFIAAGKDKVLRIVLQ